MILHAHIERIACELLIALNEDTLMPEERMEVFTRINDHFHLCCGRKKESKFDPCYCEASKK